MDENNADIRETSEAANLLADTLKSEAKLNPDGDIGISIQSAISPIIDIDPQVLKNRVAESLSK